MKYHQPTQEEFQEDYRLHLEWLKGLDSDETNAGKQLKYAGVDFRKLKIDGISFNRFELTNCIFGGNLSGMDFRSSRPIKCCFIDADLRTCDFSQAWMDGSKFLNCDLTDSEMHNVRAPRVSMANTKLVRVDTKWSNFKGSDFKNCDFTDADMHRVDFRRAQFKSVEWSGCCLSEAKLEKAWIEDFSELIWIKNSFFFADVIINRKSMSIADRHATHDEWFNTPFDEIQSYREDERSYPVFTFQNWEQWKPILKAVCDQLSGKNIIKKERNQYACAQS